MSENLYAPPQADLGRGPELALGTGDFEIGRCSSEAWQRTWANFPLWLGFGIVASVVMLASILTVLGIFLLLPVLSWGAWVFLLRMHDGGARMGDLFSGFPNYGRTLGAMLGFFLVMIVSGLPGNVLVQVGARSSPPSISWVLLGYALTIAASLFVQSRLNFVPFLMIDRGLALGEALSESWSRTAPIKWKLVLLTLFMIVIAFVGMLALLIGLIPATVMSYLLWASAYRQIFGGAPRAAA
jgi:uncharacterized membrane protein